MNWNNEHTPPERLLDDAIDRQLSSIYRLQSQIDCICDILQRMNIDGPFEFRTHALRSE